MFYFWLFAEGFIALTYQLLFFRQLTPSVGSSSVTDAWIIGAFLGAMGLGYFAGGKPRQAPLQTLGRNFLLSAIIAGIGASSFVISFYFELMSTWSPLLLSLILYCLVVIAPVAYFIGQSLPLLLQRSDWGRTASEKGGNALALSTYGSMAGAIIPITLLTPLVGATITLALTVATAATLGLCLLGWRTVRAAIFASGALFALTIVLMPYVFFPKGLFTSTPYSDIYLLEDETYREMIANNLPMSVQTKDGLNAADYIRIFQYALAQQQVEDQDVLVLGAGGFMAHTEDQGRNRYTYVDIDRDLAQWATTHFRLDPKAVNIIVDDARQFLLKQQPGQWPVIYLDTFGSQFSIPEHLVTREFFQLINQKLPPDGLLMFNMVMNPQFNTDYSRRLHATIQSVFPFCHVIQATPDTRIANMHYTCFAHKTIDAIYVDDKHTLSADTWQETQ